MSLKEDLQSGVDSFFTGSYDIKNGTVVPNVNDMQLGRTGREMELAMLFIDIRESTKIVDGFRRLTAARMYKSFLWGITKIARENQGDLRSFNGDGVLIAFSGDSKNSNATKAALQMSWFCQKIIRPEVEAYFKLNNQLEDMKFNFGIGIDVGKVLIVRGGIKGENNNDLVWVGNATNYAVKYSSIKESGYYIYISKEVYNQLNDKSKCGGENNTNMWEKRVFNEDFVYRSGWIWTP